MCVWRIKDCEVHSYHLFCINCVLVSSSASFCHGAEGLDQFRFWWWFLAGASEYWHGTINFAELGTQNLSRWSWYPDECFVSFWKSSDLFRSLIGLRKLILATKLWITWPKYKPLHVLVLCLTREQPVKEQVFRLMYCHWPTRYEVMCLCSGPVLPCQTMLYLLNL